MPGLNIESPAGITPVVTTQPAAHAAKPVPGTPEYDAEMVRIARESRGEAEDTAQDNKEVPAKSPEGESGELILGKFKSQEDLLKAYQELEKKLGAPKDATEVPPVEKTENAPEAGQKPDEAGPQAVAGIPIADLESEVQAAGDLSAETREKLTKAGIPADYIDSYLNMYKVAAEAEKTAVAAHEAEIKTAIGGDEAYKAITSWAATNLTPGEIDAFNKQVEAGRDAAMLAVFGLKARYESQKGKAPRLVGGSSAAGTNDVFSDKAAFLEAMSDPRYRTSEAYRNQVTAKLGRTRSSGVNW